MDKSDMEMTNQQLIEKLKEVITVFENKIAECDVEADKMIGTMAVGHDGNLYVVTQEVIEKTKKDFRGIFQPTIDLCNQKIKELEDL